MVKTALLLLLEVEVSSPYKSAGLDLGRKPGCEKGKHQNKLEPAKTNQESITTNEKLLLSHCLLLSIEKVAKKKKKKKPFLIYHTAYISFPSLNSNNVRILVFIVCLDEEFLLIF